MGMTEKEREAYLAEIEGPINDAVDAGFKKLYGYTYRGNDVPSKRATPAEQNGHSRPKDDWEKIRQDFPDIFGPTDAA